MTNCHFTKACRMLRPRYLATGWLLMWVLPACSGAVSEDGMTAPSSKPGAHGVDGGVENDDSSDPPTPVNTNPAAPTTPTSPTPAAPGEVTRLARLTHAQYANTVADLFGVENMADTFPPDALNGFEFSSSIDYLVDGRMAPRYQQAAETIAATTVADTELFSRLVPCDDESDQCRDEFVAEFGLRAFRRPLTDAEQTRIVTIFSAAGDLVGGESAFRDGVQVVIEALLQSPYFLYRTELSNAASSETVPLTGFEVASRLSYFLFDSMPDEVLFAAARAGELSTAAQVQAQVERMLLTDEALEQLVSFHEQAWHFAQYSKISPDPAIFPDLPGDLSTRVLGASRAFVRDVIASDGGATELLSAPFAYADAPMGRLYGVEVDGELQRIELDPATRLGLLSQVGFLASHAHAQKTDPIHRGLFVTRDLLCRSIGAPPPGASMAELPEGSPAPKTTREEVTLLTSPSGCIECHRMINPPGFAFEGFDAVGQLREEEDGTPVETQTSVYLDGADHEIDGAVDLIGLLADSAELHACYANKWLTFAHGRTLERDEIPNPSRFQSPMSVRQLVTLIVTDQSFLARPTTEVSQ
jgi:hypothetical protein